MEERKTTILVVDDDAAVVTVVKYMLEDMGYRVLTARDGERAITVFEDHRDMVDLVMLDIVMPRIGGPETWERLRRIDPDVKTLLCSGYVATSEVIEILNQGRAAFLKKPFDMAELSGKVESLLTDLHSG